MSTHIIVLIKIEHIIQIKNGLRPFSCIIREIKIKPILVVDFNFIYDIINYIQINVKGVIRLELDKIPQWILALEQEDATFLKNFTLKSGSLKEIAKMYEVSYPTVRLRLDKLIQKIEMNDQQEEEPFQTFIKGLAVDSRIDVETAKIIIEKYKKEKEL